MDLKQEYKSIVYADDNQIYKKSFIRRGIISPTLQLILKITRIYQTIIRQACILSTLRNN